jgi:hypothetical protein
MDKLELDDRVSRLERRLSLATNLALVVGLAIFAAAFLATARMTVSYEEVPLPARIATPVPLIPRSDFELQLRNVHKMQEQGLITREDFEQKKEMILDAPLDPADDVEALRGARTLVDEGLLTEDEYGILKRKILKFGK